MALNLKTDPENLVLRQLRGLRQELAAVLANQARDRELITRMFSKMEQGFARADTNFADIRRDFDAVRSDLLLLENNLLSRHNEILDLARRVDDPEEEN